MLLQPAHKLEIAISASVTHDICIFQRSTTPLYCWTCSFPAFFLRSSHTNHYHFITYHIHWKWWKSEGFRSLSWPQITQSRPTAPPWDHQLFPNLGICYLHSLCWLPACFLKKEQVQLPVKLLLAAACTSSLNACITFLLPSMLHTMRSGGALQNPRGGDSFRAWICLKCFSIRLPLKAPLWGFVH